MAPLVKEKKEDHSGLGEVTTLTLKVDIPEFEGHLDSDLFLDWLWMVERVFDYKDVSEEKKVKLVALKLRKYASIWWANVVAKRARKGKAKIRS